MVDHGGRKAVPRCGTRRATGKSQAAAHNILRFILYQLRSQRGDEAIESFLGAAAGRIGHLRGTGRGACQHIRQLQKGRGAEKVSPIRATPFPSGELLRVLWTTSSFCSSSAFKLVVPLLVWIETLPATPLAASR